MRAALSSLSPAATSMYDIVRGRRLREQGEKDVRRPAAYSRPRDERVKVGGPPVEEGPESPERSARFDAVCWAR